MAKEPELTPLLKASSKTNTRKGPGKGPLFGAGKDQQYSAQEVSRLPAAVTVDKKVWRNADKIAQAALVNRRIELVAQDFGPDNELRGTLQDNLTELAKQYPHADPDTLIGLASGMIAPLPDSSTAEPFSDQGAAVKGQFDNIILADVLSRIDEGVYGATSGSTVPTVPSTLQPTGGLAELLNPNIGGLTGLGVGGEDLVPDSEADTRIGGDVNVAPQSTAEGMLDTFVDTAKDVVLSPLDNAKNLYNTGMNVLFGTGELANAATEVSYGNEQKAAELTRRADLTVEQAEQLFGKRGLPDWAVGPLADSIGRFTTDIDPATLVNTKGDPKDATIPVGDISFEQAQQMWRQHLIDTEQITDDGQRSFGSITGRTTLGQQNRSGTLGEGGWFGGAPEAQEKARDALAHRQSDIRTFEEREASRKAADAVKTMYEAVGLDLSLDEYTNVLQARTWTEGRALTAYLHDKGVPGMSPGSRAEMFISGMFDGFATLAQDPVSYVPVPATGVGKAAVSVVTRGRIHPLEAMMRNAGDDLTDVGQELNWVKQGNDLVLADSAGAPKAASPRLTRRSFHYEDETGHQVRKVGSRWEVHTPARIAGDPDELAKPIPRFRTKKEAEESLNFPLRKVELWDEAGNTGPGKSLDELKEEQRTAYTRATGEYTRKVPTSQAFWDYITGTQQGSEIVDNLVRERNAYKIWLKSGQKFTAEQAERLAKAESPAEVRAIMAASVGPDIRDTSPIANFVGVRSSFMDAKIKLASGKVVKNLYRWAENAPNGQPVDLADKDDIIRQAHRLGVAMQLTPEQLDTGINRLFELNTGAQTADYLLGDFMEEVIFHNLRLAGVKPERVKRLRDKVRRERGEGALKPVAGRRSQRAGVAETWEDAAAQALATRYAGGILLDTQVSDGQYLRGLNDEASLMGHEVLASHALLPTAREIRRDVTRIAKIMHRNSGEADDNYDIVTKLGAQALDRWRNFTLMNTAYLVRSIGEEMFSQAIMGRGGALHNPVAWLGSVIMLHHQLEYASGFRKLSKIVRAARAATGAQRRATVRPDEYRGAKMIDTQDVLNSLSLPRDVSDSAVGRSGREVGWDKFEKQTRRGIINPIIVEVDMASKRVKVADGLKRLVAADRNDLDSVPVIIRPGTVPDTEGSELAATMLAMHGTQADEVLAGSRDITHELLFRPSAVRGDIADVVAQARAAVEDTVAHRLGLGYVAPWMSTSYARLNGETWAADIKRAVEAGDNYGLSQKFRQLTFAQGSAMLDEHPNKLKSVASSKKVNLKIDQTTGKVDWADDGSRAFVRSEADILAEIGSVREVRDILSGARTLDEIVEDTLDNPDRVQDILTQLDHNTRFSVAHKRKIPEGMTPDAVVDWYNRTRRDNLEMAIREYFQDMLNNVSQHTGKNMSPRVRKAVMTGSYEGKPLGAHNKKFVEMLKDELDNNADFRDSIPPRLESTPDMVRNQAGQLWTQKFFETVGNVRDMATLHPLLRQTYVQEIERLAPYMTREAYDEQLRWVRALGDKKLTRALEKTPPGDNGWLDAADVDDLADRYTRKIAEDTFYNAVNRQNWAVGLRWAAPFAQAAASSTRRWGKGMITQPLATYRTVRNLEGFKDAVNEWETVDALPPGLREIGMLTGFLDENEYGEEIFVYPAIGSLATHVSGAFNRGPGNGEDPMAATATMKSLDVFGGGLFGAMGGPAVSLALSMTPLRSVEARPDIYGDIVRFLQPYGVEQEGNIAQKLESAFVPAKWVGAVLQDDKMVNDMSKALLISRLSTGEYGPMSTWTEQQAAEIRADVNRDARLLISMESLAKVTLPALGGFDFTPLIKMPDDLRVDVPGGKEGVQYLLPHMLKAEYDRYMEGADDENRAIRQATFLRDWGEFALFLNYGSTKSNSGITYSNPEASKFAEEEPGLYQQYRESIGLMLPGGDWDAEYDLFEKALSAQDKARGVRTERNPQEQWEFLRQKALQFQKGVERDELVRAGAPEEEIRALGDKYADLGLTYQDTAYTERHLANLRNMLADDRVLDAVPSAKYIKRYIEIRDKTWQAIRDRGMGSFSSDEALNTPEVAWLYATGIKAAADDKGFRTFWDQVASQEFESEG